MVRLVEDYFQTFQEQIVHVLFATSIWFQRIVGGLQKLDNEGAMKSCSLRENAHLQSSPNQASASQTYMCSPQLPPKILLPVELLMYRQDPILK